MDFINERANFYCTITADILYRKDLSPRQKLLIAMISNLSNVNGYCWASNSHFAEALDCDERTIRRELNILEEKIGLGRIMNLDKDGKEYFRILVLPEGLNRPNLGDGQTRPGDRTATSGGARTATSANKQTIKTNKKTLPTAEKEFNSPENSSALFQLDSKHNWETILSLWMTSETSSVLNTVYKKYFLKLDREGQESIVSFIKSLGNDIQFARDIWISSFLKNGSDLDSLRKDIEKKKQFKKTSKPINNQVASQEDLKKSSSDSIDLNQYL